MQLRPAGLNERRCICRDVFGLYGSIITCAKYTVPQSENDQLPLDDIFKALKQCIVEHPVLCTVVENEEKDQVGRVEGFLQQVHNDPFDSHHTRPAWRLFILPVSPSNSRQNFYAAFATSHALADGLSALRFHTTFRKALQDAERLPVDSTWTLDSSYISQVDASLENATLPISWSFLLGPLLNEYLPPTIARLLGFASEGSHHWTGASARPELPTPQQPIRTALKLRMVPSSALERALAVCRTHNARLTGLLVFVAARALSVALRARNKEFYTFRAETAIDLRRCIESARNNMGNYVSAVTQDVAIPLPGQAASDAEHIQGLTNDDWRVVKDLTDRQTQASSTLADQPVALLKYLTNVRDWTLKQARQPSNASFSVSNLGLFDNDMAGSAQEYDSQDRWNVEDLVFSQSADATGAPFNINIASTKQGPLAIVASWWPGMLGEDDEEYFMDEICSGIVKQLESIKV